MAVLAAPIAEEDAAVPNDSSSGGLPLADDDGDSPPSSSPSPPLPLDTKSTLTLSFDKLSVHVPGKKTKCYSRLLRPFKYVAEDYFGMSVQDRDPLNALTNITGLLTSGELCLVLGSNDESKSTLLRALSGRLSKQDKQSGTIALNGMPMEKSYQGWRRLCPYVGPSDQDHAPVLTVRETFDFARRCTASAADNMEKKKSNGQNRIEEDVRQLMMGLGLDHVADTVVGDENLRGISGGQKRRVTVGEMLLDKTCKFVCMENITDGLSSSDSIKLIADLANVSKKVDLLFIYPSLLFFSDIIIIHILPSLYTLRHPTRVDIRHSYHFFNQATKW